jgi:hypothetical protein
MGLQDDLLRDALQNLTHAVDQLRADQREMQEQVHAAVLDNTTKVSALDTRMTGMEASIRRFKTDVRKEARRWGAIGGACSAALAIVAGVDKGPAKRAQDARIAHRTSNKVTLPTAARAASLPASGPFRNSVSPGCTSFSIVSCPPHSLSPEDEKKSNHKSTWTSLPHVFEIVPEMPRLSGRMKVAF